MATAIVWAVGVYAALGVVFAAWFLVRGIGRLDPVAGKGGVWFRLIIGAGVVSLWPVLVGRVVRVRGGERSADAAGGGA